MKQACLKLNFIAIKVFRVLIYPVLFSGKLSCEAFWKVESVESQEMGFQVA